MHPDPVATAARAPRDDVGRLLLAIPEDQWFDRKAAKIVAALRRQRRLSTGEVAELLGVSRPVAGNRLTALRESGVVEWVGRSPRDPRAFWQLRLP